jgi:hypothetical protein
VSAYGDGGIDSNATMTATAEQDAPVPYRRCPKAYPGVGLSFRALAEDERPGEQTRTTQPPLPLGTADDPLLPPGQNVDAEAPFLPAGDGSCRAGTLTRRGYAQALRLGLWLRRRYCRGDGGGRGEEGGQRRLACPPGGAQAPAPPSSWRVYSSRLRRTVATLRGVLTGLSADEALTRELIRAMEAEEEEEEEDAAGAPRASAGGGGNGSSNNTAADPSLAADRLALILPTFEVAQCATHAREFMYGQSRSCPALAARVKEAEGQAQRSDATEPAALAAARVACARVLGGRGGCASDGGGETTPPLNWRRLMDVVTAMLAEHGARGGLKLLPLPGGGGGGGGGGEGGGSTGDAAATAAAPTAAPSDALLRALGDMMAYASRHEARVIAPADPADRTVALGVGPLVERIRAAVAEAAAATSRAAGEAGAAGAAAAAAAAAPEAADQAPNLVIYSGHDSTLMPLLAALGAPGGNAGWPPYASSLVFEVWGAAARREEDEEGAAARRVAKTEGRRERAGHKPHDPSRPSSDASRPLVRVLHDGRLFQERDAGELVRVLGAWALGDAARAVACERPRRR